MGGWAQWWYWCQEHLQLAAPTIISNHTPTQPCKPNIETSKHKGSFEESSNFLFGQNEPLGNLLSPIESREKSPVNRALETIDQL